MENNIILLSIDALRADHLSCYGYERNTSPFLNEFVSENIQFTNSYSAAPNTREGVPALLAGQFPDKAIKQNYKLNRPTIASFLSEQGFNTGAFHSNPYASRAYSTDRGFQTYDDDLHLGKNKWIALFQRAIDKIRNKHYVRAEQINERSLRWIDELPGGESFFLWNHYMDVHGPYEPLEEYRKHFEPDPISDRRAQTLYQKAVKKPESITDAQRERLINLYDGEIRYVDACLREFVGELDERGVLEDSLIIITGDHGDAFGEHGYYEHPRYLHPELLHVPILIKSPREYNATSVSTPASTLDIAPTILKHTSIEADLPGESLFTLIENPQDDRVVFSQVRGDNTEENIRRFSAHGIDAKARGHYNFATDEITITAKESETVAKQLERHISQRVDDLEASSTDDGIENAEIERRLEALGYK